MKLILASSSPRRAEILGNAGICFEVRASHIDEARLAGEAAEEMVARLAEMKAHATAAQYDGDEYDSDERCAIVGADTCIELDGEIFGKPDNAAHAREMLTALSGRVHRVITGICVIHLPQRTVCTAVETTTVAFAVLAPAEICAYVESGEPFDKAGGYAIQGLAGRYITRIEGCYFNVVGLPLARLYELLKTSPE